MKCNTSIHEMYKETIEKELKLHSCGFEHAPVDSVVRSQWHPKSKSVIYLIYRWLFAVFVVAVVIIALEHHLGKYTIGTFFIYLTCWGIAANMVVGVYSAVLVTIWNFNTAYRGNSLLLPINSSKMLF